MQSSGVCVWDAMWAGGIVHYLFGDNVYGAESLQILVTFLIP